MEQQYIESTLELLDFIADSPTAFHAARSAVDLLEEAGFIRLDEKKPYEIKAGASYYVVRNSSAVIAFSVPSATPEALSIIAAHTDSPCFKIKENPEITNGEAYTTLNVEGYGGMIMSAWFDRPLSIAGRAFVKNGDKVEERLVNIDRNLCVIPNLCIHQNRELNSGYRYNIQKDLLPLIAEGGKKGSLNGLVSQTLEVSEEDIVETELFLYSRQEGTIWGLDDEFYSSPRIDDLQCAFSAVKALTEADFSKSSKIRMISLFDNEEVGSTTKQGANSDFLFQTWERICDSLGLSVQQKFAVQASGFMLSADNGHSFHPNYPEKCDPTNRPLMNKGVMIKYAGNQKYTTDGHSAAVFKNILDKASVPYQVFFNNSSVSGGSTLGNISQIHLSLPTADIGSAQLSMHSPYETGGVRDTLYLTSAMKAFFED
ncbi:MAG: M18 family aminopeptidase [Sphaerochaetaceae bacterium]|nr:M18 family aminopeptidase [Sphaerochaetaceae bacterium]